ncbi:MAG: nucleotidyltransferase family protein [Bacteroidota bacterium]
MDYSLFYFRKNLGLRDIVLQMEERKAKLLIVVDQDGKLLGTISDTDIRRALLTAKYDMEDIMNPHPIYIQQGHKDRLEEAMAGRFVSALPVVDSSKKVIEVIQPEQRGVSKKPNKVVLMVGGLGRRLGELTQHMPKPMLPLGHKPILHIILDSFLSFGFEDFYFCVNYKAEIIREYFGDGSAFGANIQYIEEAKPLGTAGPLSLIEEEWEHPFIVMNGDLITTLNFESLLSFHQEKKGMATMCLHEHNYQLPFGVVNSRNSRILSLEEKPLQTCFVNAGIYVMEAKALEYLPYNTHMDMTTLFDRMMQTDEALHSYIINEFWLDIGQVKHYEETHEVFTNYNL